MIFARPNLSRAPMSAMTATAAALAIAAALLAGPGATEMLVQSAGVLVEVAEAALDTPRIDGSAAQQIASATGFAGLPGGGVLGVPAASVPAPPAPAAVGAGAGRGALQSGLVLLLLAAANLLALGPRLPDGRLPARRQSHPL